MSIRMRVRLQLPNGKLEEKKYICSRHARSKNCTPAPLLSPPRLSPQAYSDSAPPQRLWVLLSTFHRRRFFLTENTKAALLEVWTLFFYLIKTWIEVGPQQAYGRKSGLTEKRGLEEFALCHSPTCLLPNVYGVNKEYAEPAIMEHCLCAHPGKCIYSTETISKQNINTKGEWWQTSIPRQEKCYSIYKPNKLKWFLPC